MKGLTTKSEIDILKGFGLENLTVHIQRDESTQKWCIQIKTTLPNQEDQIYFIERQKGGMRTFAHLEDAIRAARTKFGKAQNFEIFIEKMKFILGSDDGDNQSGEGTPEEDNE